MGDDNSLELKNVPKVIESMPANDIKAKADKLTHEFKVLQENNKFYECVVLTIGVILSLVVATFHRTCSPS